MNRQAFALILNMVLIAGTTQVAFAESSGRAGSWTKAAQGSPSLSACLKAIKKDPKNAVANNDLGWAYRQNGDLLQAEKYLREAIKLQDAMPQAHSNLSVVLFDKNEADEAVKEAMRAVELDGNNAVYRVVLGNALSKKGDTKAAIEQYKKATELKPDYQNALYNLGRVLKEDGQTAEAKSVLAQALRYDPRDDRTLKLLDEITEK